MMSELKAGDRVRRKGFAQPFGEAIGTLKPNELSEYASAKFLIEFDNDLDCGHDCYGQTADNRGWFVYCTDLWEKVMDKLKVGDWIEITGNGYNDGETICPPPMVGARGVVKSIDYGEANVYFPDEYGLHSCHGKIEQGHGWTVGGSALTPYRVIENPEKPTKLNLKVGDIVESLGQEPGGPKAGLRGTVVFIDRVGSAAVDFPDANDLHSCGGRVPDYHGWWVFPGDMNKFKVVAEKFDDAPVAESDEVIVRVIGPDVVEIGGLTWSKKDVIELISETKDDIEACEKEIRDSEQELVELRAEQELHQLALKKLNEYVAPEPVIGAGSWVRMRDNLPVGRLVGEIARVCDVFDKGHGIGYTVEFPQRYDCLDPDGDKPGRKMIVHSKYVELA